MPSDSIFRDIISSQFREMAFKMFNIDAILMRFYQHQAIVEIDI